MPVQLVIPALDHLADYTAALKRGWSPDNIRLQAAANEELAQIAADAPRFVERQTDIEAKGGAITMPDGSSWPRLPGFRRWIWHDGFCGSIGLRWQPGTPDLPPHCLGHIGYSVVPWRQNKGYATKALELILPDAMAVGLPYVDLTTDPENTASQKVILKNGGILVKTFIKPAAYGSQPTRLYRIPLQVL